MKAMSLVIGACIIILLMAAVLAGITQFRSDSRIEPYNVVTGGGVTTATVVLAQDLFDDSTAFVTAITSNVTSDAAVAASYVAATNTLTVSGLEVSASHQLQITYRYPQLASYWGADLAARMWPVLLIIGIIGLIVAAVYSATKGSDSG